MSFWYFLLLSILLLQKAFFFLWHWTFFAFFETRINKTQHNNLSDRKKFDQFWSAIDENWHKRLFREFYWVYDDILPFLSVWCIVFNSTEDSRRSQWVKGEKKLRNMKKIRKKDVVTASITSSLHKINSIGIDGKSHLKFFFTHSRERNIWRKKPW